MGSCGTANLERVCRGCGELARHRPRADDPTKPRALCVGCTKQYLKRYRSQHWQTCKLRDTWRCMIRRCHDPRHRRWDYAVDHPIPKARDYQDRGIKVCRRWRASFAVFCRDVGLPPTPKHELDRRDNRRGYSPSNTRWVTRWENSRNRSTTTSLTAHDPVTGELLTLCHTDWSARTGAPRQTIAKRLKLGWTPDEAVTPLDRHPDPEVPF